MFEPLFDLLRSSSLHGSAPWMPISSDVLARIDAGAFQRLRQHQHVGRRAADDARLQIADELDLTLGLAAARGHDRAAQSSLRRHAGRARR